MRSSSPRSAFQTWSCDLSVPDQHAEVGQAADERVGGGLEDLRTSSGPSGSGATSTSLPAPSMALTGGSSSGEGR